jgi:cation diffusion facilitator family transporter
VVGHGKLETLATLAISTVVMVTGGGIGVHAVMKLMDMIHKTGAAAEVVAPSALAFSAVMGSVLLKEFLYRQSMKVATKFDSKLMAATAWHHRSDSISSLVAMVGIGGAMMHFPLLDPLAGMLVAGMIVKAGAEIGKSPSLRSFLNPFTSFTFLV